MIFFIFFVTKQMKMSNLHACCLDFYLVHHMSTTNFEYVNSDFFTKPVFHLHFCRKSGFVDSGLVVDSDEQDNNIFKPWAFLAFRLKKSCSK